MSYNSLDEALGVTGDSSSSTRQMIIVDNELRIVRIAQSYILGVYNDKDVAVIPFQIPRYYHGNDLSTFDIRVNYLNAANVGAYSEATNVSVSSDYITFEWLLGAGVFSAAGSVTFVICMRKVGDNGLILKEYNTTRAKATVLEGLEIEDPEDPEQYSILTQMKGLAADARYYATQIEGVADDLRSFVGSPLTAATAEAMTNTEKVYVYTGSETGYTAGNWYYHNGTNWVSGGVYNATVVDLDTTLTQAGKAADAKAVGDEIADVKSDLLQNIVRLNDSTIVTGMAFSPELTVAGLNDDGLPVVSAKRIRTDYIPIVDGSEVKLVLTSSKTILWSASFYDIDDGMTPRTKYTSFAEYTTATTFAVPSGTNYIRLIFKDSSDGNMTLSDISSIALTVQSVKELLREEFNTATVDFLENNTLESGSFKINGTNDPSSTTVRVRSKEYVPVLEKTTYSIMCDGVRSFDISVSFYSVNDYVTPRLSYTDWITIKGTFETPENCKYIRFLIKNSGGGSIYPADVKFLKYGCLASNMFEVIPELINDASYNNGHVIGADLLKKPIKVKGVGALTYVQSFCVYDGDFYSINGSSIGKQDSTLTAVTSVSLNTGHGNSMQLGSSKYAYASGWDDNTVYKVDLTNMTVDDTITLPTTGYTSCVIDDIRGLAYIFQRDTYPTTEESYNFIVYDYVNGQTVSTKKTIPFAAMQACDLFDDKIFVLNGLGTVSCPNGYRVYDLNGNILAEYFLPDFAEREPEGICVDRDTHELYISFSNKALYKITI